MHHHDQWLRSRRDHDRFLSLIEVLAYLVLVDAAGWVLGKWTSQLP